METKYSPVVIPLLEVIRIPEPSSGPLHEPTDIAYIRSSHRMLINAYLVCRTSEACRNSFAYLPIADSLTARGLNTTLVCSTDPTAYTSSQLSCNVNNPTLRSLFPLESRATITRTVDEQKVLWANASGGNLGMDLGGSGSVFAQLWYEGVEQVRQPPQPARQR